MSYVWLLLIVVAASLGQVFLKLSVLGSGERIDWLALPSNKFFISGVMLYALTSIAWMYALKTFPLSKAYPMLALTFVSVPLLARVFFKEQIRFTDFLGMALILAGVVVINGVKG